MEKLKTHFIVQTACANMPSSCWGIYRRVAVLEVDARLDRVSMISERARGCVQVVTTWEKCNVGKTDRCAYAIALREAHAIAHDLNWSRTMQDQQGIGPLPVYGREVKVAS